MTAPTPVRHLVLRLDAPLMSFGSEAVDAFGVVRDFPARSAVTGLVGNALGWDRADGPLLDRLQQRLVMGSVRRREGRRVRDFQTAQLGAGDRGWTTRGRPEGRAGGAATYASPHIRYRDADADALVLVVLRLHPAEEQPDLDAVAAAMDRPERPLFIGRKPFLPSGRLHAGSVCVPTIRDALEAACRSFPEGGDPAAAGAGCRAQWPESEGEGLRTVELTDRRNWRTGVHAGLSRLVEGTVGRAAAAGRTG